MNGFSKILATGTMMLAMTICTSMGAKAQNNVPKVYFFKEISSENLVKIYEALGWKAEGKVAVKLSTGEPGNNNYLNPNLHKDLVQNG